MIDKRTMVGQILVQEIHEIFFCTFSIELYKWIAKLADGQGRCRLDSPIVWTTELVRRLESYEDNLMRAIDHWLNRVIGGFVIEFAVDTSVRYNEVERHFFKGPRGKYFKSLNNWIKMLLCEKWVMPLP